MSEVNIKHTGVSLLGGNDLYFCVDGKIKVEDDAGDGPYLGPQQVVILFQALAEHILDNPSVYEFISKE